MIPNILSIAGSDPSGGAGIQADIKAISASGGYAMAALTALTAQNTQGVTGVHLIPPGFVAEQIDAVFADVEVHAVKIGMIATAEIAEAVAEALARWRPAHVVLDPVMVAKGGARLLDPEAAETLRRRLLPFADIVTPNLPEAAALTGMPEARSAEEMPAVAAALRARGARGVLLKGGHLEGAASPDLLLTAAGETWLPGARVETRNTHGTGCSLSAALAAELAKGAPPEEAARRAKVFVAAAIAAAGRLSVGSGVGPIHHFHQMETDR
ncbi:MAG: bifunctional hydroxymethylpyrimidine kinase/phosphomethylpyrimidine kinase [Pikeienuella sp.]|uniref:bifunctional hydroxymethylpyrimidine kinase/phosphomethylpyrimidine kinase n=1 Tax=Pikeienuella sp. TaxID=2831957 RepID=UPI00391CD335